MAISTIHQAKTHLSALIERAERGEETVIARGKQPVVRLVPIKRPPKRRIPGLFKGEFKIGRAFFEPLSASELEGWE
jgi:prevent-host-death family protein